jgi:gamma-glutamyltranspeptidase/glutathione hydrolase
MNLLHPTRRLVLLALLLFAWSVPAVAFDPGEKKPGRAAIASAHYLATEAGHEILEAGGNAFDAAIAVSTVLAVVEQTSSGIGGGGFWLLHRAADGYQVMVDGREQAPGASTIDMYLDAEGNVDRNLATNGPLAAAIPGEIAALEHIAENYGRLPLATSLQPAIRIAREGFPVYEKFHTMLGWKQEQIARWPAAVCRIWRGCSSRWPPRAPTPSTGATSPGSWWPAYARPAASGPWRTWPPTGSRSASPSAPTTAPMNW